MKRGGPPKRTVGLKRTPMRRSAATSQRAAIPAVSAKRQKVNRERAVVVAELRAKTRNCQANAMLRAGLDRMTTDAGRKPYLEGLQNCRPYGPLVPHEPQKRSRRGSLVDPDNILMVCENCNAWCELRTEAATEVGLLVPSSFERDGRA